MSPDARKESPPVKFRAVLPPELKGVDLEQPDVQVEPERFEQWAARLDDRLETLEAE